MEDINTYYELEKYIAHIESRVPEIIKGPVSSINFECYNFFLKRQKYIANILSNLHKRYNQKPSESICVCYKRPKTHALFFDRVEFLPFPECIDGIVKYPNDVMRDIPEQLKNYYSTSEGLIVNFIGEFAEAMPMFNDYDDEDFLKEFLEFTLFLNEEAKKYDLVGDIGNCVNNIVPIKSINKQVERLVKTHSGLSVTPAYDSEEDFNDGFADGDYKIIIATIDNLKLIEEDELEWEQVLEFRRDRECRAHYKKFLNFVKEARQKDDYDTIVYDIEHSYYLYQNALKKHGIKTVLGCISDVINIQSISSTAMIAFVTNIINDKYTPASIAIGTGINLVIQVAQKALNYEKPKADDSIAWIYDLKEKIL